MEMVNHFFVSCHHRKLPMDRDGVRNFPEEVVSKFFVGGADSAK